MGNSAEAAGGLVGDLFSRRGGGVVLRVDCPEGTRREQRVLSRKKWEVDMGADVTPASVGIVLGAEVLMHVLFLAPEMHKSDGALCD